MFNTKKTIKRRLSAMLAFAMGLSLCSGFGFAKSQTAWAAEDVAAVEETVNGATAVSGGAATDAPDADVPTGSVMHPVMVETCEGLLRVCAYDSEGNAIAEATAGTEITVEVDLDSPYLEFRKFMGWVVLGVNEAGEVDTQDVVAKLFDEENAPTTFTFTMPDKGVEVNIYYGMWWSHLDITGGKVIAVEGDTEWEFDGYIPYPAEVTIEAVVPAGKVFSHWELEDEFTVLEDPESPVTSFYMPMYNVVIRAVFADASVDVPVYVPTTPSVEEKDPNVVTEEDVFTKEELKLFDELKVDVLVKEAQEKAEALVSKVLKYVSEETRAIVKEKLVLANIPADENTPAVGLKNDPVELFIKTLSLAERLRVMKGENVSLATQVKDVTDMVSKAEKLLVDKAMKDIAAILNNGKSADDVRETKLGMFLDLSLVKKVGNDTPSAVKATDGKLEVSIQVPAALQNKKADVQRVYQVLLVEDGETILLDANYNTKTGELAIETDVFGTFALIYTDMPAK